MITPSRLIAGLLSVACVGILFHAFATTAKCQQTKKDNAVNIDPYAPRYVFLTYTDPKIDTAYYRNRLVRAETKLVAKANSGFDRIRITDEAGEKVFVQAKVIRVDTGAVYIQNGMAIHAWKIGTTLDEALRKKLSEGQRVDLKLEIDQGYAKEMSGEKKK